MNLNNEKYSRFALCREMLETPDVMRGFNLSTIDSLAELYQDIPGILLTGEGSSRIFPAKRSRTESLRGIGHRPEQMIPITEGATQAFEYLPILEKWGVLGASNSGRTRELVRLFRFLRGAGHSRLAGITAHESTPLKDTSDVCIVLNCGPENAVAATKSVVEQALVIHGTVSTLLNGEDFPFPSVGAEAMEETLNLPVPGEFARAMATARTIFFAGRNDGVAEELALKTNEIVRKPSDYLEGTYAAHGIEEIMVPEDVVILVNPFPEEEAKLKKCLSDGVGSKVFAISHRDTMFPTLKIPETGSWNEYIQLAAGWNLLVEAGIEAGADLDKPQRARKVGNEVD